MDYVLQTFDLSKKYKKQLSVNKANINIRKGDIYGFVGENGSGKTTFIRLVTGLIMPTEGHYRLFGVDNNDPAIHAARRKMGAVVESPAIYLNMTAKENLVQQATALGIKDPALIQETLQTVGLGDLYASKKLAENFSLGMRQRLGIAMALLSKPEFLILDEPMNGLDPSGIVEIRELILRLNREGITFMISSHILTELSLVATKYGIISKGKLLQEITAQQLHDVTGKYLLLQAQEPEALLALSKELLPDHSVTLTDGVLRISGTVDINRFLKAVIDGGCVLESVNCKESDFEEYYLSVIGGNEHA